MDILKDCPIRNDYRLCWYLVKLSNFPKLRDTITIGISKK